MHTNQTVICPFPAWTKGSWCPRCGFKLPIDFISNPVKVCGNQEIGLGTRLALLFKRFHLGKSGCIACSKRERAINKFSSWLYCSTIGLWNGKCRKPSKAQRRKALEEQVYFSSQEKDARREAHLAAQNNS